MAGTPTGLYVPAEHIDAIRGRVEALAAGVNEIMQELESFDLINISMHRAGDDAQATVKAPVAKAPRTPDQATAAPKAAKAQKAAAPPKRQKAPKPSDQAVSDARAKLEAAVDGESNPKAVEPRANGKRPFVKRERFGKLREHLEVEHGKMIADHMVELCGNDRVTLTLRKVRDSFIGTFPGKKAAAEAYAQIVEIPHAETLQADDILAASGGKLELPEGGVAVWGSERDADALRRYRQKEQKADHAARDQPDAATA